MDMAIPGIRRACTISWRPLMSLGFTALLPAPLQGQVGNLSGTVYDSLSRTYLSGAAVLVRTPRDTILTTDALGRFSIGGLPYGSYSVEVMHSVLDRLGIDALRASAKVDSRAASVLVTTPSLATISRRFCGSPVGDGQGVVFGTVEVHSRPVLPHPVVVSAAWRDLAYTKDKGFTQKQLRIETITTDSLGSFALCGLPVNTGFDLVAEVDTATHSDTVRAVTPTAGILRIDVAVDGTGFGSVAGRVVNSGRGVPNARVVSRWGEALTDSAGHFMLQRLQSGTREVEVRAIGFDPVSRSVRVIGSDTARMLIELSRIVVLDSVNVTARTTSASSKAAFMERRRMTPRAYFRDSTTLGKMEALSAVFGDMPMVTYRTPPGGGIELLMNSSVRGVRSIGGGMGNCRATVWVDGQKDAGDLTVSLRPKDIAGIEVYLNSETTPIQFGGGRLDKSSPRGGPPPPCGTVVIWTKRAWP